MPAPTTFADLSTTAASNFPSGGDNVFPTLDDTLRVHAACLASIMANTGNGWTSPYIAAAGALVWNETGAAVDARFEGDTDANLLFLDGSADTVGIGTATPLEKLHIGQGNICALRTGGSKVRLLDQNNEVSIESAPVGVASELVLKVNLQEAARIDQNGNVKIVNTISAPGVPTGGGYLYVEAGALKFRGSSGTITTLAPA